MSNVQQLQRLPAYVYILEETTHRAFYYLHAVPLCFSQEFTLYFFLPLPILSPYQL